jgi:hypothetical protein
MKLKFLIGLVFLVLGTSVFPTGAVETPNRNLQILSPGTFAFVFSEGNQGTGSIASFLIALQRGSSVPRPQDTYLCSSMQDLRCAGSGTTSFDALSVLGPCLPGTPQACVKGLTITGKNGVSHKASLIRVIDAPTFPADASFNLPEGNATSLWRVEDFDGIKDYAVTYFLQSHYYKGLNETQFSPKTFSANIYPYKEIPMANVSKRNFQESVYPDGHIGIIGNGIVTERNCAWTEKGICGAEQEFDEGVSAELTIYVPNSLTGWMHGRLIDPEISVTPIGNRLNELKLKAKPADVPSAYAEIPYSQTTDEMKQLYKFNSHAMSGSSVRDNVTVAGEMGFKYMSAFEKLLGDKAQIKSTSWKFGSLDGVNNGPQNKCLQSDSKILGLVTTNAMLYENTLPTFDKGFLNYKVGGLHFNPNGTPFKGTYDLVMRSETARCLYGFSNAPVSAEISVVSADGEKQVATTRLSESKNWIHLSAYNFGFSSPTIQMQLKQLEEPKVVAAPSPSPTLSATPSPVAVRKSTITCIKGKMTKKVTATNPKCPMGYKKK